MGKFHVTPFHLAFWIRRARVFQFSFMLPGWLNLIFGMDTVCHFLGFRIRYTCKTWIADLTFWIIDFIHWNRYVCNCHQIATNWKPCNGIISNHTNINLNSMALPVIYNDSIYIPNGRLMIKFNFSQFHLEFSLNISQSSLQRSSLTFETISKRARYAMSLSAKIMPKWRDLCHKFPRDEHFLSKN